VSGSWFSTGTGTQLVDGVLQIESAPGRYIAWIAAFVILCPLSWWCWRRRFSGHLAPSVFLASFLIPLIVLPGIAVEKVHVSPTKLSVHTGFWFSPTVNEVSLANLESIAERSDSFRNQTFWYFRYNSGEQAVLDLPDLLKAHRAEVTNYLGSRGVEIKSQTVKGH